MIQIAKRDFPFFVKEGESTVLPCSSMSVKVFPAKVFFYLEEEPKGFFSIEQKGPFTSFSCTTNLEKARVEIRAKGEKGFFSYSLRAVQEGIELQVLRGEVFSFSFEKEKVHLKKKETYLFPFSLSVGKPTLERLSFGVHKKQEVLSLQKRKDLKELLPLWLRLGQMLPNFKESEKLGLFDKKEVENRLQLLFSSFFTGFFVPHREDQTHQNLNYKMDAAKNPYVLLKEGANVIRELFVQEKQEELELLPNLPRFAVCGRFCSLSFRLGTLDLEWRKTRLRRAVIRANREGKVFLKGSFKKFRVRKNLQEKGYWAAENTPIFLEKEMLYYLDRFQF